MSNFIYSLLIGSKARALDMELKDAIKVLEKYGKFSDKVEGQVLTSDFSAFKHERDEKLIYDIFYYNMHIHTSKKPGETIYSIRIKNDTDKWIINDGDTSHPINKTYEIYVWYDVPVLDITHSWGNLYKHGNWDKYVYKTVRKFLSETKSITDDSEFNEMYDKKHKVSVGKGRAITYTTEISDGKTPKPKEPFGGDL